MLHKLNKLQNVKLDEFIHYTLQSNFEQIEWIIGYVLKNIEYDSPHNIFLPYEVIEAILKWVSIMKKAFDNVLLILILKYRHIELLSLLSVFIYSHKDLVDWLRILTQLVQYSAAVGQLGES